MSVSGDVEVQSVDAPLTARSVSGDVTVGRVTDETALSTTSGDVEVRALEGGSLRVQTVSGDVRVGISRGARVWVDAASVSGRLESELGLEDESSEGDSEGVVVPLHVKTVSGGVSVMRAASALSA